jgi:nucleotide-binding universal stress UspA family protein
MATVLNEDRNDQILFENSKNVGASQKGRPVPSEFERELGINRAEIVVPIDDFGEYEDAVDQAVEMAKNFDAKIVLMYATPRTEVPQELLEYSRMENDPDLAADYFNSLGDETISKLGRRIERAGVEWRSFVFWGSVEEAVKSAHENRKAILVVLSPPKKSRLADLFGGLTLSQVARLGVPVLVT